LIIYLARLLKEGEKERVEKKSTNIIIQKRRGKEKEEGIKIWLVDKV
jgi:hypothetical protein